MFVQRGNSARSHIFGGEYAGENADGNERENEANFKKIYDRSSDQKADNIGHRPNAAKKIDNVHIAAIDALIEI